MKSTRRNFLGAISGLSLVAASGTLWAQTASKEKFWLCSSHGRAIHAISHK